MLNSVAQKEVVKQVYAQIEQFLLCIKGNCTDNTEAPTSELEKVTCAACQSAFFHSRLEAEVISMVKSDCDGIGTLLVLLDSLKVEKPTFRDERFEEMAQEFSNLMEWV